MYATVFWEWRYPGCRRNTSVTEKNQNAEWLIVENLSCILRAITTDLGARRGPGLLNSNSKDYGNFMNIIIVTGITSGLGKGLHDYLVEHWVGHKIFLSREEYPGSNDRSYIKQDYSEYDFEGINSRITDNVENIIFINNASTIYPIKKSIEVPMVDLQNAINVNYKFPAALASTLIKKSKFLKCKLLIFNITSGAANRAIDGWAAYCSTKAAIKMMFEVMALEYDHVDCVHYDRSRRYGHANASLYKKYEAVCDERCW